MAILQPKHLALSICIFLSGWVMAQENNKLYPSEKSLLELIANDTISHTVSYLPEAYQFSIADKGDKHFILLKSGKGNYFLLDGTNRVYIPDPAQPAARLIRIDSTSFTGDNFNMMAFIRKDTLYQYGGYGFWNNRDFFSFYRPTIHGWEFLTGGDALQNLYTFNYYDEKADKFFTIGRYSQDTHKSFNPDFHDSIYSYDLNTKKWVNMGKIANPDLLKKINSRSGLTFSSPFGFGVFHFSRFQLIDFTNNRIYALRTSVADSVELDIKNKDSKFQNLVYLRDTLFIINGDETSVSVQKFRFTKLDIALASATPLYVPVISSPGRIFQFSITTAQLISLSISLLVAISLISFYVIRKTKPAKSNSPNSLSNGGNGLSTEKTITEINDGKEIIGPDIQSFFKSLNNVEQDLLKEIITHTLQGEKMDTHEINKILGVSQKETEIQKTRRSMTITRINNLYAQSMKTNGLLIQRERDPFDKRAYLYSMPEDLAKLISVASF